MGNASGQQRAASKIKAEKNESEQEHKQKNLGWAHTTIPP